MSDDPVTLKEILNYAWIVVVGLVATLWQLVTGRIKNVERSKANTEVVEDLRADVDRHGELFQKLFDRVDKHSEDDREFHKEIMTQTHTFHTNVLEGLRQIQKETYQELSRKADKGDSDGSRPRNRRD